MLTRLRRPSTSPVLDNTTRLWLLLSGALCLLPMLLQLPFGLALCIALAGIITAALIWRNPMPSWLRLALTIGVLALVFAFSGYSFGRDTGCALLAAMSAIKPSELNTIRDGRSLLGFSLFSPFGTFLLDQGPTSWVLGLLAMLCVLVCMYKLTQAESTVDRSSQVADWLQFRFIGRLLLIGLPLAMAAFWLFPRLPQPFWGVPERSMGKIGLSDQMSPGEWQELMADDTPALRVRFHDKAPPPNQRYWRGPVLWNFDGVNWKQAEPWMRQSNRIQIEFDSTQRWSYELEMEATERRYVVALDLPVDAPADTSLTIDGMLFTDRPLTSVSRWQMQSAVPLTFDKTLDKFTRRLALQLPAGLNPRAIAMAQEWRKEAGSNDQMIIDRMLAWIQKEFIYTLDLQQPGKHNVDQFLFETKEGFCQQYSSSFVVVMRAAGIPARVVTGYAGGIPNRYGDYWLVRNSDAHAWTEIWLEGKGWIRIDPTAAVAPERIYDTIADRSTGELTEEFVDDGRTFGPLIDLSDWVRYNWNDMVLGFNANRQRQLLSSIGIKKLDESQLIALFALFAGIALLGMLWLVSRKERINDPLLRAWKGVNDRYKKIGLERKGHESAYNWAQRVRDQTGDEALLHLSDRFNQLRYGTQQDSEQVLQQLIRDIRQHRP